jgi:uncharacterized protein (TIGR03118 family)
VLSMHRFGSRGLTFLAALVALVTNSTHATAQPSGYTRTNLVSDNPALAPITDPNLVNGWGIASLPGSPWWVNDNGTGLSTLYDASGNIQSLVVTIPPSASNPGGKGSPTGIVGNPTSDFGGAPFLFASEDGVISAWHPGTTEAAIMVDKGALAVYKGLTSSVVGTGSLLYAANFHTGTVEVYDATFQPVDLGPNAFRDRFLPAGFAPFNVQAIGNQIFVAFALQDMDKHDEVQGPGLGFVDAFTPTGTLIKRYMHGPFLNAPWGLALAPSDFGQFSGNLLVGQFGSGHIIAYDINTGEVKGALQNSSGLPITIRGLWGIGFGNGGAAGPPNSLYFAAGPANETHGLYGVITAN